MERSKTDPQYASIAGAILCRHDAAHSAGLTPQFMTGTIQQATVSNNIKIFQDTITDPTSLPKKIIKITEQGIETAVSTRTEPLCIPAMQLRDYRKDSSNSSHNTGATYER